MAACDCIADGDAFSLITGFARASQVDLYRECLGRVAATQRLLLRDNLTRFRDARAYINQGMFDQILLELGVMPFINSDILANALSQSDPADALEVLLIPKRETDFAQITDSVEYVRGTVASALVSGRLPVDVWATSPSANPISARGIDPIGSILFSSGGSSWLDSVWRIFGIFSGLILTVGDVQSLMRYGLAQYQFIPPAFARHANLSIFLDIFDGSIIDDEDDTEHEPGRYSFQMSNNIIDQFNDAFTEPALAQLIESGIPADRSSFNADGKAQYGFKSADDAQRWYQALGLALEEQISTLKIIIDDLPIGTKFFSQTISKNADGTRRISGITDLEVSGIIAPALNEFQLFTSTRDQLRGLQSEIDNAIQEIEEEYCGSDFAPTADDDPDCNKTCDKGEVLVGQGANCRCLKIDDNIRISLPLDPTGGLTEQLLFAIENGFCQEHQLPEVRRGTIPCVDKCQGFHNIWHPDDKCLSYDDVLYMQLGVRYDRKEDGKSYIEIQPPPQMHSVVGDQYVAQCPGHRVGQGTVCQRPPCSPIRDITPVEVIWFGPGRPIADATFGIDRPNLPDVFIRTQGGFIYTTPAIRGFVIRSTDAEGILVEKDNSRIEPFGVAYIETKAGVLEGFQNTPYTDSNEYRIFIEDRIEDDFTTLRIVKGTVGDSVFDSRTGDCINTQIWGPSGGRVSIDIQRQRIEPCNLLAITDCQICINYYYPDETQDRAEVITSLHRDEVCLNGTVQRKANYCGFIWGLIYNYGTNMCEPACGEGMVAESINADGTYNCRERIEDGDERDTYENYAVEPRAWPLQTRSGNASIPLADNPVFKSSFIRVDTDDLENIMNDPYYQLPPESIPTAPGRTLAPNI